VALGSDACPGGLHGVGPQTVHAILSGLGDVANDPNAAASRFIDELLHLQKGKNRWTKDDYNFMSQRRKMKTTYTPMFMKDQLSFQNI